MNLDLVNDLFNNLKENKIVQNFIKELSNYLENSITNNKKISDNDFSFNNINLDDLNLYGEKVIVRYRDKMLTERGQILQKYSENTKEKGEMYYIYDVNSNDNNAFNLCLGKNHQVIIKQKEELPEGATLGSVLREKNGKFVLDQEGTKCVGADINKMIKEKIEEQNQYLDSKRIEGHIYEVDEKYSGRIWLYDLNNKADEGMEGIEEIEFPKDLYETAENGDKFIYQNGEYQKYELV